MTTLIEEIIEIINIININLALFIFDITAIINELLKSLKENNFSFGNKNIRKNKGYLYEKIIKNKTSILNLLFNCNIDFLNFKLLKYMIIFKKTI